MKTLYIIRHAKSSWNDSALSDFDRPLNKRGEYDAPLMGQILKEKGVHPDVIISSPALRAKTTAEVIAKGIGFTKSIVYNDDIYESSSIALLRVLGRVKDKHNVAFLVSHNPGINMLVDNLVGLDENIPTCGVVEIEFDCKKWSEISSINSTLISFDYPKRHK